MDEVFYLTFEGYSVYIKRINNSDNGQDYVYFDIATKIWKTVSSEFLMSSWKMNYVFNKIVMFEKCSSNEFKIKWMKYLS